MNKPTSEWQAVLDSLPQPKARRKAGVAEKRGPNPETLIQKDVMTALRAHGLWVVRVPGQGTLQHVGGGKAILKPSELVGFPDLLVIGAEGVCAWLEVKTATGRPTQLQQGRIARLAKLGHVAAIVRSAEQALTVMRENGFIFCPIVAHANSLPRPSGGAA